MKCPACNSEIAVHSDSCAHCGAPAYLAVATQDRNFEHCTYCGTREESTLSRCSNCGLKRGFKVQESPVGNCSNCGDSWRNTWLYCRTCGIIRKQGLIEVIAPLSVSFQAFKNYPVTTFSAPALSRQDRFLEPALMLVQPRQEEEFKETSFSSDEFEVRSDDPMFSAPMMTENEVVGRMFINEGGDDHYEKSFETDARESEPSITVYDLQEEKAYEVVTEKTTAAPTLQKEFGQADERNSVVTAPLIKAPVIYPVEPPREKPNLVKVPEQPPVQVENKPVQSVRPSKKARGGTQPPVDKFLVKLIIFLIGSILLFAGLIVSGYKIRDLFFKAPATPTAKISLPIITPPPSRQLSEPSHTSPEIEGMSYVPGGNFMMGEDNDPETERASPAHQITVQPFYMDRTEVTNSAYAVFVKEAKYPAPANWKDGVFPKGTNNLPVVNVSWDDANAYAKWAGKRLPTEAEWEFAARSNDGRLYPWGKNWLDNAANTIENSKNTPVEVGKYAIGASPFEIQDMAGNVWEWTLSDVTSYRDPEIIIGSGKVIRGGSFSSPKDRTKATYRGYQQPEAKTDELGFRCVKDVM